MARRREHFECESRAGLGCLVYGTAACLHKPKGFKKWKQWARMRLSVELWWVVAAVAIALAAWLCMYGNKQR